MSLSGHRARKHNVNKAGDFVPKKMFPCGLCGRLLTSRSVTVGLRTEAVLGL
jgi:hypothetical protein